MMQFPMNVNEYPEIPLRAASDTIRQSERLRLAVAKLLKYVRDDLDSVVDMLAGDDPFEREQYANLCLWQLVEFLTNCNWELGDESERDNARAHHLNDEFLLYHFDLEPGADGIIRPVQERQKTGEFVNGSHLQG